MQTIESFDIKNAHRLVREQRSMGVDVEWDGWDIVFYRPSEYAMTSADGVFRNGQWAFANRFSCDDAGLWNIETRNLRRRRGVRRPVNS